MKPNLIKLKNLVESKKAILVNNKLVMRILGFSDMRDFAQSLHSWGYCRDFIYQTQTYDWQRFLRLYLKETFLD